ncbi:MAG: 2-vinyl bacteriochlorophyllide hydratase, partial [Pseudomonadota bacterium]
IGTPAQQLAIALLAYGTYVINAGQFIWKLRQARLQARSQSHTTAPYGSSLPQGAQS